MVCSHEHCGDYGHVGETALRIVRRSQETGVATIPADISIQDVLDMAEAIVKQDLDARLAASMPPGVSQGPMGKQDGA